MTADARQRRPHRILDTAFRLFYAHGIRAVGVDRIIAESGVAKATFYKHFPAKDDLVVAYLDKVDETWTGQLQAAAEAAGPDSGRPAGRHVRRARHRLPSRRLPRLRVHQRRRRERGGHRRSTTARWPTRTPSAPGSAALAADAGATDPDALARALTLLLDGGLASGSVDGRPDAPWPPRPRPGHSWPQRSPRRSGRDRS